MEPEPSNDLRDSIIAALKASGRSRYWMARHTDFDTSSGFDYAVYGWLCGRTNGLATAKMDTMCEILNLRLQTPAR